MMSFQIANLRNPFSTQSSDSFIATFRSSNGYVIARQAEGMSVSVNQGGPFSSIAIARDSLQNGVYTRYQFTIQNENPTPTGSILLITIPESIKVKTLDGTFIDCMGQGSLKSSIECKLQNNKIQVQLDFKSSAGLQKQEEFQFSIFEVRNPNSVKESESLKF